MTDTPLCETCGGPLADPGVIWDMGYRVAAEHGCDGDAELCARICPVPTPDIEMVPTPCPNPDHARDWTNAPA